MLKPGGSAAVVLPDNVLFEGGAGETLRRRLLDEFDLHTILRLPTGIFYSQGVKADVLFFERLPAGTKAGTWATSVYDLRTNMKFTLKERPLARSDMADFIEAFRPNAKFHERRESERFKAFDLAALLSRDKLNLDISWLKDENATDPDRACPRRMRSPPRSWSSWKRRWHASAKWPMRWSGVEPAAAVNLLPSLFARGRRDRYAIGRRNSLTGGRLIVRFPRWTSHGLLGLAQYDLHALGRFSGFGSTDRRNRLSVVEALAGGGADHCGTGRG
jgi:hypothetical protein